jgi:putative addiction module component (TIGR02574 family)
MVRSAIEIEKLGVEERLELIEKLWDSLSGNPDQVPVPDSHKAILDQRLDEIDAGDDAGIPWDDVLIRIRNRLA